MMNKSYILHFVEIGAIVVLTIIVLSPKLFNGAIQRTSLPPMRSLETVEDVYDDLNQLGCEIIHVEDEYSTHRFSMNFTEFRKIAYKTKVVVLYTVHEGTIVETAIAVQLD